jgi:hypothetical protein
MTLGLLLTAFVLGVALVIAYTKLTQLRRAEFIRNYSLPTGLFEKLRKKYPQLSLKDCQLASHALRQFFLAYLKSNRQYISMPSQVADELWHEFILYTRTYELFCRRAFGGFLHHTPAAAISSSVDSNTGLRRCWWHACREENINPDKPTRLPLIFAIDRKLSISDGFIYLLDCRNPVEIEKLGMPYVRIHCGGDVASLQLQNRDRTGCSGGCSSGGGGGDSSCGDGGGCGGD